jgi:hypothetical protein
VNRNLKPVTMVVYIPLPTTIQSKEGVGNSDIESHFFPTRVSSFSGRRLLPGKPDLRITLVIRSQRSAFSSTNLLKIPRMASERNQRRSLRTLSSDLKDPIGKCNYLPIALRFRYATSILIESQTQKEFDLPFITIDLSK